MSASNPPTSSDTPFTLRRTALLSQISTSLESVLQQINALNRSLEGVIEIGNEFASVEALWSQFEGVMGQSQGNVNGERKEEQEQQQEGGRDDGQEVDGDGNRNG